MSERLADDDLDRLEALAEGATPGPWERVTSQRIDGPDYAEVFSPGQVECMAYCYGGSSTIEGGNLDADLEFIAFARDALPALVAEVRAAREREVSPAGRIVTMSFEDGKTALASSCSMEPCDCPEHDAKAPRRGTYLTVLMDDEDLRVGFWRVRLVREAVTGDD